MVQDPLQIVGQQGLDFALRFLGVQRGLRCRVRVLRGNAVTWAGLRGELLAVCMNVSWVVERACVPREGDEDKTGLLVADAHYIVAQQRLFVVACGQ